MAEELYEGRTRLVCVARDHESFVAALSLFLLDAFIMSTSLLSFCAQGMFEVNRGSCSDEGQSICTFISLTLILIS